VQVVALLAGIVDPKHRLDRIGLRSDGAAMDEAGLPRRLSPFDEAALEIALKLRDAHPAVRVSVVLPGGPDSDPLVRAVAALRPHRAFRFGEEAPALWDPGAALPFLAAAVRAAAEAPDLVLTGREFGDTDDGALPAALAEAEGWRFAGLAHAVEREGGELVARRMRNGREEALRGPPPLLASVTNERGNRLRHPLLKNVVLAKRAPVEHVAAPAARRGGPIPVLLRSVSPAEPARRGGGGRVLTGPVEAQVAELAAFLAPWRSGR
jgi:electron transfer flavoprotein beta subunit